MLLDSLIVTRKEFLLFVHGPAKAQNLIAGDLIAGTEMGLINEEEEGEEDISGSHKNLSWTCHVDRLNGVCIKFVIVQKQGLHDWFLKVRGHFIQK